MTRLIIALALSILIAGCSSSTPTQTATESLITLCQSYATALNILTPLKIAGALTSSQIATVDQSVMIIDPICTTPTAPADVASASAALSKAMATLQTVLPKK